MNRYILTHASIDGEVELGYDAKGRIIKWHIKADISDKQYEWLLNHIPSDMRWNKAFEHKGFLIRHIPPDLSFDAFWNGYAYKVGNRTKCKQLWDKLSDGGRIAVLESLPRYGRWLKRKQTIDRIYPERYLSQKRYENDFK